MQSRGGADASYEIVELALQMKEDGLLLEIKKKKRQGKNEDCKEKKGRQNAWETLVEIGWNVKNPQAEHEVEKALLNDTGKKKHIGRKVEVVNMSGGTSAKWMLQHTSTPIVRIKCEQRKPRVSVFLSGCSDELTSKRDFLAANMTVSSKN